MNALRTLRTLWLLGGLAFVLAGIEERFVRPGRFEALSPAVETWHTGGFRSPGVYPTTVNDALPPGVRTAGSWLDSDTWQGRTETAWFATDVRVLRVAVAGYPNQPGCKLWAEWRERGGKVTRIDCPLPNPHEQWRYWEVARPKGAEAIRIVAEDASQALGGWLAFSEPFVLRSPAPAVVYVHARAAGLAMLGLALSCAAWLGFLRRQARGMGLALALGTIVLIGWAIDGMAGRHPAAVAGLLAGWLAAAVLLYRMMRQPQPIALAWRWWVPAAALAAAWAARASYAAATSNTAFQEGPRIDPRQFESATTVLLGFTVVAGVSAASAAWRDRRRSNGGHATVTSHGRTRGILQSLWIAAGAALLLGASRDTVLRLLPAPRELPRWDGAVGQPWISEGFVPTGAHQYIAPGLLPPGIASSSSWVGGDDWQGDAESAWFRTSRRTIHIGVAGHPQHPGIRLWAEFRPANGAVTRVDCPLADPAIEWSVWELRRPVDAVAVRILAVDTATGPGGWVAFSHPFRAPPGILTAGYQHAQLWTTVALALVLVWGPGLCWWRGATTPAARAVRLIATGPLLLATGGLVLWCCGGWIAPATLGTVLVTALWLALGWRARTLRFDFELSAGMRRTLAVMALLVVAVVAKSSYSIGPEGELFRGSISRNLTVGDRIDARYPYHVVQAIARNLAPASPATEEYFYPWTFFSRGPLAGLVAAPVVFATGGQPPKEFPDQRWEPFDRHGFAAYRITMMAVSAGIVVALFTLLVPFVGEAWAFLGAGLLALTPFGIHEAMFTWPKWSATTWVGLSFVLAHAGRVFGAGLALAVGFLFHPLALLWAPWVALWTAGRSAAGAEAASMRARRFITAGVKFSLGLALLVAPWMILGAVMPHLPTTPFAGQGGFIRYLLLADSQHASWATWWSSRWMNFANTFLPLQVYFAGFDHFRFQSAYEPSGSLVKFAFVWWNTLPFGLGLALWTLSLGAITAGWRTLRSAVILFVVGPALFITIYWGMDPLGLMRECGHPLFVAILATLVIVAARSGGRLRRLLTHSVVPWIQLPEVGLMLWLTTLLNPRPWAVAYPQLDALAFLVNVAALIALAALIARGRADLEKQTLQSPA